MFKYLVVYNFVDDNGAIAVGNYVVTLSRQMSDKDIARIQREIAEEKNHPSVVIVNYLKLR